MSTPITCPRCRTPYMADVRQIVDVGREPQLKQALLSGQLNVAVCPNCGAAGQIATPILYHDPAHQLFMVYVPQELNMPRNEQERFIGQMVQQVMNSLPQEQRKAYLLQPETVLTMKTLLERVWGTEGVTPEMLEKQRKQQELLRTLISADEDVVDYLLKERGREISEEMISALRQTLSQAEQAQAEKELVKISNLLARLMQETAAGKRLQRQQTAMHRLQQDVKKESGQFTPAILAKHVIANMDDPQLALAMAVTGQTALDYEFFTLLTKEVERRQKVGGDTAAAPLVHLREQLLQLYQNLQQQSRAILDQAESTLQAILNAPDKQAEIEDRIQEIDDAFMYILSGRIQQAEQRGQTIEAAALRHVHDTIIQMAEDQVPPEIRFINDLVEAGSDDAMRQVLTNNPQMVNAEMVQMLEMVKTNAAAQEPALVAILNKAQSMIQTRLSLAV
ncbi:MAG: hypothetical protein KJ063_04855 [Anaerolineae bacterium]|nr:hypothetical protein [Anaerolineae bacterium]